LETKESLIAVLKNWQKETKDPLSESKILREFSERQLKMQDLSYRKDKNFRWPYLHQFPALDATVSFLVLRDERGFRLKRIELIESLS
jgi:hypothetical protein